MQPSGERQATTDRPTSVNTPHGPLRLPVFCPDATRGVVRGLGSDDLARCGISAVVANVYHLGVRPGATVIRQLGGLHRYMGWRGPILTDSGGFQIYSLLRGARHQGRVDKEGFSYQPAGAHRKQRVTAAKSIRAQHALGSDLLVCLDHCTHGEDPLTQQRQSVENTIAWARSAKAQFEPLYGGTERPALFAVVQGGSDTGLRKQCVQRLLEIGFDGFGFGGWPVEDGGRLREEVHLVAELVPPQYPLWGLGIGSPDNMVEAFRAGYRIFDCALPTRDARQGRLYLDANDEPSAEGQTPSDRKHYKYMYIADEAHVRSDQPISRICDCLTCQRYGRSYLHHLFAVRDPLAIRLATMHNLRFCVRLVDRLPVRSM